MTEPYVVPEDRLERLAVELERLIVEEGLPAGSISDLERAEPRCRLHGRSVRARLRLSDRAGVRVNHCGCGGSHDRDAPPPANLDEFARDMAEEIVWCWRSREDALAMLDEVRAAFGPVVAKAGLKPRDCRLVEVGLADVQTFAGRRFETDTRIDLIGESFLPDRWNEGFTKEADIRRFFRGDGHYWRDTAKRRDELEARGARGEMDVVAAAALTASGKDPLRIAAYMSDHSEHLLLDLDGVRLLLRWRKGRIEGDFELAPGAKWMFGEVTLDNAMLPTGGYVARRLIGDVVALPFLSGRERITCTKEGFTQTTFVVEAEVKPFGIVDGVMTWL